MWRGCGKGKPRSNQPRPCACRSSAMKTSCSGTRAPNERIPGTVTSRWWCGASDHVKSGHMAASSCTGRSKSHHYKPITPIHTRNLHPNAFNDRSLLASRLEDQLQNEYNLFSRRARLARISGIAEEVVCCVKCEQETHYNLTVLQYKYFEKSCC